MRLNQETINNVYAQLQNAWCKETAYEELEKTIGKSSVGQCYVSALVAYLLLESYQPKLIRGSVSNITHYWIEIDKTILDFTSEQFTELHLPKIVYGTYQQYPCYVIQKEDTGFKRFLLLARKMNIHI